MCQTKLKIGEGNILFLNYFPMGVVVLFDKNDCLLCVVVCIYPNVISQEELPLDPCCQLYKWLCRSSSMMMIDQIWKILRKWLEFVQFSRQPVQILYGSQTRSRFGNGCKIFISPWKRLGKVAMSHKLVALIFLMKNRPVFKTSGRKRENIAEFG